MDGRSEGILARQARHVLQQRYAFTPAIEQHLRQLVVETRDPAASALAMRSRCTFAAPDAGDCLLLLEVLALEIDRLASDPRS